MFKISGVLHMLIKFSHEMHYPNGEKSYLMRMAMVVSMFIKTKFMKYVVMVMIMIPRVSVIHESTKSPSIKSRW